MDKLVMSQSSTGRSIVVSRQPKVEIQRLVKATPHLNGISLAVYNDPNSGYNRARVSAGVPVDNTLNHVMNLTRDGARAVIDALTEALRISG